MARRSVTVDILGNAAGVKRAAAEAEASLVRLRGVAKEALGEAGLGGLGRLAGVAGTAAAAAVGVGILVGAVKNLVGAGLSAEASQARFATAMKNAGLATQLHSKAIEAYLGLQRTRGFADTQTRDSLAREVLATHNVTDALKLNNLAADIARARHIDLSTATRLAIQAFDGNTRVLKQLGLVVQPVTTNVEKLKESTKHATTEQLAQAKAADKVATANKVLNAVMQATHGQADAFAKTDAGKIAAFGAQWDHIKEVIGQKVVPVVSAAFTEIGKGIAWLQQWWDSHSKAIEQTARQVWRSIKTLVIDNVTAIWHAVQNAMKIVQDVIATVMAIISGKWGKVWDGLKKTVKDTLFGIGQLVADAAKTLWDSMVWLGKKIVDGIIAGLGGLMKAIYDAIKGAVTGAVSGVVSWVTSGFGLLSGSSPASSAALTGALTGRGAGAPYRPGAGGTTAGGGAGAAARGDYTGGGYISPGPAPLVPRTPAGLRQTLAGLGYAPPGSPGAGGSVKSTSGRAAKKGHGLDLKEAIAWATSQMGRPYAWGAGHSYGTHQSYDCSGFAANVAARIKGYTGGVGGRSQDLYRSSTPAVGDEPALFGFTEFLSDGPGHMGIKLESTIYQAGSTATGLFSQPGATGGGFSVWRVPAGLEATDVQTGGPRTPASSAMRRWLSGAAGVAAVAALGLTEVSKLYRAGQLGQIPGLEAQARRTFVTALRKLAGKEPVPTAGAAPAAVGTLAEKEAQFAGEQAAVARGITDPNKIRLAGEEALAKAQLGWINDQAAAINAQIMKTNKDLALAREKVQTILGRMPRKGPGTVAARKQILADAAKAVKQRNALDNALSGHMAKFADLQAQAAEKGFDLKQVSLEIAGKLPGQTPSTTTPGATPAAASAAELASAQLAAASESWLSVIAGTAGAQIGQGGRTAIGAASNMTFNIQALSPGDPQMLQQLARTVLSAVTSQGSFVPASSGASGA